MNFVLIFCFDCDSAEPDNRKQSIDEINLDQFLNVANYEDTVKELDIYYGIGNALFPFLFCFCYQ